MTFQKLLIEFKKNKVIYYLQSFLRQLIPNVVYENSLNSKLRLNNYDKEDLLSRVNYYNKLNEIGLIDPNTPALKEIRMFKTPKAYNFDTFEYTRYFNKNLKANFIFGDVIHVADVPSIQKSRPIKKNNTNAIILKLDKKRHFVFIKDHMQFAKKKNMLIGRGAVTQAHRIKFMELYFNNRLCDLGQVNKNGGNPAWIKPKLSISDHLKYKFILSLEGNDVATNLKWIMSSNSIAVMPKPKYETWFMEGRLIPDFHYILINDDFSNLEERLLYYITNIHKAEEIVNNANRYIEQFLDKKKEDLISLLVLEKYFYFTKQKSNTSIGLTMI